MVLKYVVAIGGYESEEGGALDTPIEIDKRILELSGVSSPKVLFIPTASTDSEKYIGKIRKIYAETLDCDFDVLLLHSSDTEKNMIEEKLALADVIYVGGGNTMMMIKLWKELGVDKLLKKAYEAGAILCGVSAGSICWFEYGISDSLQFYDEDSNEYIRVDGIGILDGPNSPHYGSELWDKGFRTKGTKKIMKEFGDRCLCVPDGGAVVFKNEKVFESLGESSFYGCWEGDDWVEQNIEV
jgi:dipeptidase E